MALVAKIQWDQKIMEKESEKKMAEIEGRRTLLPAEGLEYGCESTTG